MPYQGPHNQTPSSLFAGAIWTGGFQPGSDLKLAAKTYGSASNQTDFYPGPLSQFTGSTDPQTCGHWDRFFSIRKPEIKNHLFLWNQGNYSEDQIPNDVKGWPAKGNPFFESIYGFELPDTCLLYTSPSPRDRQKSRMPSSA